MKNLKCLLIFLALPLFFACKSHQLSREEAEQQIIAKKNLPKQVTATLYNSDDLYRELIQNGMIKKDQPRHVESNNHSGGGLFIPQVTAVIGYEHDLTEEGKKFKVGETDDYYPIVKTGELVFNEITGIADIMDNVKEVHYTLKYTNLTPFGNVMLKTGVVQETATFRKYDDGWRLE